MDGSVTTVRVTPSGSGAANPAFDVTPHRLVTGLITERGRCAATPAGLAALFPDRHVEDLSGSPLLEQGARPV
jgi:methylthioribose-1-phosphate isomerase